MLGYGRVGVRVKVWVTITVMGMVAARVRVWSRVRVDFGVG